LTKIVATITYNGNAATNLFAAYLPKSKWFKKKPYEKSYALLEADFRKCDQVETRDPAS
jgi:hypothetical protein